MLLSNMLLHSNINDLVHILVWHLTLYSIGNSMVFGVALLSCCFTMTLVEKVIGGLNFYSSVVSLILGSILRGNSPSVMVSSYSES